MAEILRQDALPVAAATRQATGQRGKQARNLPKQARNLPKLSPAVQRRAAAPILSSHVITLLPCSYITSSCRYHPLVTLAAVSLHRAAEHESFTTEVHHSKSHCDKQWVVSPRTSATFSTARRRSSASARAPPSNCCRFGFAVQICCPFAVNEWQWRYFCIRESSCDRLLLSLSDLCQRRDGCFLLHELLLFLTDV